METLHWDTAPNAYISKTCFSFKFTILLDITEIRYKRKLCASLRTLTPKVINLYSNDVIFLEGTEAQRGLPRPELIENYNTR